MFAFTERQSEVLLERNKQNELEKWKANIKTRMGILQNFTYKMQEIMIKKQQRKGSYY